MLTIEARPRVGRDQFLEAEGVALHVVDQVPRGGLSLGVSATRRHRQALGATQSYDHVLGVGTTITVHGVMVTVLGRSGDNYDVAVSGSYVMPPPNYFTENVGESVSCAAFEVAAALVRGCVR